jgi:hypothetical protein
MNTANEKFAMLLLDLPGRVLPLPSTGRLEVADLLHLVGKARQFGAGIEVEIPPTGAAPIVVPQSLMFRRRPFRRIEWPT